MYREKCKILEILMLYFLLIIACDRRTEIDFPDQIPPGKTPKIFALGIVSTALDEYGCTMSPDGEEFYFIWIWRTFQFFNLST